MTKIFTVIFILFGAGSLLFAQNYNWITPNQTYLKMYVVKDGIHRIDKTDFTSAGITVSTIDPRTVKVYYKGNQVPIYFFGESDGTFDDADYFDFYGMRNAGGVTNVFSETGTVVYTTDEYYNLYSDTSAFWVGWGGANGLRFTDYSNSSTTPYSFDYYYSKLHFETDLIYSLGQNINPDTDFNNFLNDKYKGEGWYWMLMQNNNQLSQSFTDYLLSNSTQQCRLKLFSFPVKQNTAVTNEHRIVVKVNTTQFDTLRFDDFNRLDTTLYFSGSALVPGANSASIRYLPSDAAMQTNFDFFEITYAKRFEFDSSYIGFSSELTSTAPAIFFVKGASASNPVSIYDIKNGNRVTNYTISNDTLYFVGMSNGQFEVNNKQITRKPPRIKQRQVPSLVSNSAGADYIVVYNKLFETQAEQLRSFRNTHDGFRSFKAEIEDIYDVFNYGMDNPAAVRNFTKNAFDNWAQPKFKYLCLFGRGSLDPKKLQSSSVYYRNLVPVYGNPATDGYFANFNIGSQLYNHHVGVGRLPAYTVTEAQDMVNKIMSYESLGLPEWIKTSLFVTGGKNYSEQQVFIAQTNYFINSYIATPPLSSNPVKIYLGDSTGMITYNYPDSIISSINAGALIINYMAHASYGFWNNVFDDPVVLSNQNKYPLIFSMTCFTGRNADPSTRGYGEKFCYYPGKGSIGFLGTTAWSLSSTGNTYNDLLISSLVEDTSRRIGDIVKRASGILASYDTSNFHNRNTINCYDLLGDPAVKLLLPAHPEFDLRSSDYSLSDDNPQFRKNVLFEVFPKNLGTYADSCKIRFQVLKRNTAVRTKDTVIRGFGFRDTMTYYVSFDTAGDYSLKVVMDPDNWYPSDGKSNNSLEVPVTVRNFSFVPLKPENNQVIYKDTVDFIGVNPNIDTRRNSVRLMLQVDTSSGFSSPLVQNYQVQNMTGVKTKIRMRVPLTDSSVVYHWRLNAVLNNADTLGWSEKRTFTYHGNFTGNDSLVNISRYAKNQFTDDEIYRLSYSSGGYLMNSYPGNVAVSSFSGVSTDPTYMVLNKTFKYLISSEYWGGLLVAKISKVTGTLTDFKHFRFSAASSSDSLIEFLNTFDSTYMLALVKHIPNGVSSNLSAGAKALLRQFGSYYADSVSMTSWGRWSFISYRSQPNAVVSESYKPSTNPWNPAMSSIYPAFYFPYGTITQTIGPAQTWQNFNWNQTVYAGSSIKYDVIGIGTDNSETTLMSNVTTNNLVDLQSVNAYQYPKLKLLAKSSIDTVSGIQSAVYKGMSLKFIGPPEIALDNNSIFKSDSIVTMGDSVGISGLYYNIGYVPLNGHIRSFYALDGGGNKVILRTDTVLAQLKVDSSMFVKALFKAGNLPIYKKYLNQIAVALEIIPLNQNDVYTFNNTVISTFYLKGSIGEMVTEVYSDGTRLYGNDYVRSKPEMIIKLTGKSIEELIASDSTLFRIMLNGSYISLNGNLNKTGKEIEVTKETDKGNFIVRFTPKLQNGLNYLNLISNKGDFFDTVKYVLNVTDVVSFRDVFNYPNPMKDNTTFTFNITGADSPGECRIKIFSVAGRVIKEIVAPGNVGINNVYWDGRDADGDYVANGVYFYRLLLRNDPEKNSDIQKLVVLK